MRLFIDTLAAIKLPGLAVMVGKALGSNPPLDTTLIDRRTAKASFRLFSRGVGCQRIRLIGHASARLHHLHMAVTLVIGEWALRRINGYLIEICRSQPR